MCSHFAQEIDVFVYVISVFSETVSNTWAA